MRILATRKIGAKMDKFNKTIELYNIAIASANLVEDNAATEQVEGAREAINNFFEYISDNFDVGGTKEELYKSHWVNHDYLNVIESPHSVPEWNFPLLVAKVLMLDQSVLKLRGTVIANTSGFTKFYEKWHRLIADSVKLPIKSRIL